MLPCLYALLVIIICSKLFWKLKPALHTWVVQWNSNHSLKDGCTERRLHWHDAFLKCKDILAPEMCVAVLTACNIISFIVYTWVLLLLTAYLNFMPNNHSTLQLCTVFITTKHTSYLSHNTVICYSSNLHRYSEFKILSCVAWNKPYLRSTATTLYSSANSFSWWRHENQNCERQ